MRKRKSLTITIILALIVILTVVLIVVCSRPHEVGDLFQCADYPYAITQKNDGTITLTIGKGEYPDGRWNCTVTDDSIVSVRVKNGKESRITFKPQAIGTTDVALTLNDGQRDVYLLRMFYVSLAEERYLNGTMCYRLLENAVVGDRSLVYAEVSYENPAYAAALLPGTAGTDVTISCDTERVKAYYVYADNNDKIVCIKALEANIEDSVTIASDTWSLTLQIAADRSGRVTVTAGDAKEVSTLTSEDIKAAIYAQAEADGSAPVSEARMDILLPSINYYLYNNESFTISKERLAEIVADIMSEVTEEYAAQYAIAEEESAENQQVSGE